MNIDGEGAHNLLRVMAQAYEQETKEGKKLMERERIYLCLNTQLYGSCRRWEAVRYCPT